MKYIRTEDKDGNEEIFLFPREVEHAAMMEMLGRIKNTTAGSVWHRVRRTLVSAGFVNSKGECYGQSYSLNAHSFGESDTELLRKQMLPCKGA